MDDSNMSMFDLSINDLWESSYHIFFYTYVVIWILVAYRTHKSSNQRGNLFAGLGSVILFGFIGLGDGRAGYASGNFYAEPKPVVNMKKPSVIWHWGKALFEKWWLWHWF